MHHPTDRIAHTTAFVTPVVEHWLEREIAQWVHPMKDRSDDPSHHEQMLLPQSYISLLQFKRKQWREKERREAYKQMLKTCICYSLKRRNECLMAPKQEKIDWLFGQKLKGNNAKQG